MENTCGGDEDVLIQILLCLPVKSLLRFKSVCKSWCTLIQSSFFIDLHTTSNSSSSSRLGTFILQTTEYDKDDLYSCKSEIKMFMLSSGSGNGGGEDEDDDHQMVFKVSDLEFSPFYKNFLLTDTVRMVGSCNGLICLHDSDLRDVSLWNPATRQFRILPKSINIDDHWDGEFRKDFVAFGFDVKTQDYKVVWIRGPMEERCMYRVQVYSLSTDSWRLLEDINSLPVMPNNPSFRNQGIYMNGSYFFVGSKNISQLSYRANGGTIPICNNSMMLSFDFTKEIFTTMQFPDNDIRDRIVLSYLGEKMVVFITRGEFRNHGYEYCDIWVLNEHGSCVNKESWTKLHSFRIKNYIPSPMTRPQPICISNNGEFALITATTDDGSRKKLQLFNLVTKEAQKDFTNCHGVCRADVYKQSLVSTIGGNGAAAAAIGWWSNDLHMLLAVFSFKFQHMLWLFQNK